MAMESASGVTSTGEDGRRLWTLYCKGKGEHLALSAEDALKRGIDTGWASERLVVDTPCGYAASIFLCVNPSLPEHVHHVRVRFDDLGHDGTADGAPKPWWEIMCQPKVLREPPECHISSDGHVSGILPPGFAESAVELAAALREASRYARLRLASARAGFDLQHAQEPADAEGD